MSSIENRENPYSKSPLPRSRSDFNYVGLTPRDKRWSTDFSNLLPNFNRESSGYLRLHEEKPVTNQPQPVEKPQNANLSDPETSAPSNGNYSMQANILNNRNSLDSHNIPHHSPLVDFGHLKASSGQRAINRNTNLNDATVQNISNHHIPIGQQRSSGPQSSVNINGCCNGQPVTHSVHRSPMLDPSLRRSSMVANSTTHSMDPNIISRSPTMDPNMLRRSPLMGNNVRRSPTMDPNILRRSPLMGNSVSGSPILDPKALRRSSPLMPSRSNVSPTLDSNVLRRSPLLINNVSIRSPMLESNVRCHRKPVKSMDSHFSDARLYKNLVRSPTVDPKLFRHSKTSGIRKSPTLDPALVLRSPGKRPSRLDVVAYSPTRVQSSPTPPPAVVRSQSLKCVRRDPSLVKLPTSESAHCDVNRPCTLLEENEDDVRRLRNFSVTSKGVVNWGDSFRSHSLTSVPLPETCSGDSSQWDAASTRSYPMASSSSLGFSSWQDSKAPPRYRVVILGAEEVGKTSLIRQFQTSEYICAFDNHYDVGGECAITVILNEEESELEFVDHRFVEEDIEDKPSKPSLPSADAHVIVYSVTNRRSFLLALEALSRVQAHFRKSAVLLVGNKSDLVRVRAVTADEGQIAAKEKDCPFIETSVAINHQVDELLVNILSQIRARCKSEGSGLSRWTGTNCSLTKAKGILKKFLKKACFQSKSCDNLQRL